MAIRAITASTPSPTIAALANFVNLAIISLLCDTLISQLNH